MARKTTSTTPAVIAAPVESTKIVRARATRSRSDVADAYSEIVDVQSSQEPQDPKMVEIIRMNEERVRKNTAGLSVDKVLSTVSATKLEMSRALDSVIEVMQTKLAELQDVAEAVNIHRSELERLHKIDIAATSLDQLIAENTRSQAEFEAMTAEKKAAWAREDSEHARFIKERNEDLEKLRRREQADYDYNMSFKRKAAEDDLRNALNTMDKTAKERIAELEKDFNLRNENLKAREQEFNDLKAQVAAFPEVLRKELSAANAIVTNTLSKAHQQEMALVRKDIETNDRIFKNENAALTGMIAKQAEQIVALQSQLEREKEKSQSVVLKALDGASAQMALREVQNFASSSRETSPKKG